MNLDRESYVACAGLLALAGCSLLLAPLEPSRLAAGGSGRARPGAAPPLDELHRFVSAANRARAVRHLERYGPVLPDTTLLVVQARHDAAALARLLRSLRRVPEIGRALLVVSHALYEAEVERELRGVDFCRVLQVYYPYSAQLYPRRFPGPEPCEDATDCGSREPARVERKQHWWWTADLVFERLEWSRSYFGHAVFLDEDSRVTPDLLHVLCFLQRAATAYFPHTALLALGGRASDGGSVDALLLRPWEPASMASPAFTRTTWLRLAHLASFYCIHDDASWSRSLQHALAQLPRCRSLVLAACAPRVLSPLGGRELRAHELFPARMHTRLWLGWAAAAPEPQGARAPANTTTRAPRAGQFADLRDQMMCLDSYMATTPEPDEPPTTASADSHLIEIL